MPILNIRIMQGYSAAQKTRLLEHCSRAVVASIAAPLASVRIVLDEAAPGHVIVAGEIGKAMALVLVHLLEGRAAGEKAALIAALNQAVQDSIGISGQDVRVILTDVPNTDMGMAGGMTAQAAGR